MDLSGTRFWTGFDVLHSMLRLMADVPVYGDGTNESLDAGELSRMCLQ
jgi:hypothetical protein